MNGAEMVCNHSLNDSKEVVAASESLTDVIQYYSSSSDDEPAEDRYTICRPSLYQTYNGFHSETTASESSSFGSLVEAYSSSSETDEKPTIGDAMYVQPFYIWGIRSAFHFLIAGAGTMKMHLRPSALLSTYIHRRNLRHLILP